MNLSHITSYIQSICDNISSVLDVDVTLVTRDLIRIAGTGIFKEKIGQKISQEAIYYAVLKENKSYVTTQFNSRLAKHTQIPFTKHNKRARSVGQPAMLQPVHALLPLHHWHRQTF